MQTAIEKQVVMDFKMITITKVSEEVQTHTYLTNS